MAHIERQLCRQPVENAEGAVGRPVVGDDHGVDPLVELVADRSLDDVSLILDHGDRPDCASWMRSGRNVR